MNPDYSLNSKRLKREISETVSEVYTVSAPAEAKSGSRSSSSYQMSLQDQSTHDELTENLLQV